MADQNEGGGVQTDAATVPQGAWAIVTVEGLPDAPTMNRIEADGFEIRHIVGPLQTTHGPVTQLYVKRVSSIVRPPLRGV